MARTIALWVWNWTYKKTPLPGQRGFLILGKQNTQLAVLTVEPAARELVQVRKGLPRTERYKLPLLTVPGANRELYSPSRKPLGGYFGAQDKLIAFWNKNAETDTFLGGFQKQAVHRLPGQRTGTDK